MADRRCDHCRHVDTLAGVHPMRCRWDGLRMSLPVSVMRAAQGKCGPGGALWETKAESQGKESHP